MAANEPADEMREIIQDFIVEAKETLENLDRSFLELEKSPDDPDLLNSIFRAVHTIKGAAGFLGFTQLVEVAHRAENILNKLRQGDIKLNDSLTGTLLKAIDMIKSLLGHIEAGDGVEENISGVVAELDAALQPASVPAAAVEEPAAAVEQAEAQAEVAKPIGEILIEEGLASKEAVEDALDAQTLGQKKIGEILIEKGEVTQENLDSALEKQKATKAVTEQTIRVEIKRLDGVLNLVGELVLGRNRLSKLTYKLEEKYPEDELVGSILETTSFMDLITSDLQMAVMKTRMQPIKKVFNKFPRMVWDLAHGKGKDIDFEVIGEETELDKSVIEEIGDPLVHLLRNSVDHGIEAPEERVAAGKPAKGRLALSAGYEGNHVIISLLDDGKGLDLDAIKAKAVKTGVVSETESERLSEKEIIDLVFLPGLSTAKVVSDVSGRGVGMDVVKSNITKLKGTVDIETARGRGTKVMIRLPLTVAILQALMVGVGGETYALPLSAVSEIIRVSPGEIKTLNGKEVINRRGKALSLVRLEREFSLYTDAAARVWQYVVVLSMGEGKIGLLVDELQGQEDVVIKSMGDTQSSAKGIAGATITGDGNVVLILDIEVLIKNMINDFEGAQSPF